MMGFLDHFHGFTLKLPKQKSTLAPEYIWSNAGRHAPGPAAALAKL
jgi:hypothetical protein